MTVPASSPSGGPAAKVPNAEEFDMVPLGGRLGLGDKPAVIVVDAVRAYSEPESPLYLESANSALHAMADVIECARQLKVPVFYTTVRYERSAGEEAPIFARKVPALEVFSRGNELAEIHPSVSPGSDDPVMEKRYASGFFKTALLTELNRRSRDTVIIVGFSASGCVRATALDAIQHDFIPIIVREAVADRTPEITDANLADLQTKYAEVMALAEAMQELRRIARAMDGETPK